MQYKALLSRNGGGELERWYFSPDPVEVGQVIEFSDTEPHAWLVEKVLPENSPAHDGTLICRAADSS